jgi:Cdc6-like AAA superfamily ATPase
VNRKRTAGTVYANPHTFVNLQQQTDMWQALLPALLAGDPKALARSISLVENEVPGYEAFLAALPPHSGAKIIGLTGPPGAGKSTLADALIKELVAGQQAVGCCAWILRRRFILVRCWATASA